MKEKIEKLANLANETRKLIIDMIFNASSGHPGGSLSCADILTVLYMDQMNLSTDNKGNRIDKFVISKGHAAPAYYAVLAQKGFIPMDDLKTLRKYNSYLEGHPSNKIPGVDVSSGSLGQGLSVAAGMALAKKISNEDGYVYVLLGDGEIQEGQIWESLMSINKYNLNNLIVILDNNGLQIDGTILDVKNVDNLEEKFSSFGLNVQNIDGHNIEEIINAIKIAKKSEKPNIIIAKTVKGKGVSFMENQVGWHGKSISSEDYEKAMSQLGGSL